MLTEANKIRQEERNTIRLLYLLEKCLPYSADPHKDKIEIIESIMAGAREENPLLTIPTLRRWYKKYDFEHDLEYFDAEILKSERVD